MSKQSLKIKFFCEKRTVIDHAQGILYFKVDAPYGRAGLRFGWRPSPAIGISEERLEYARKHGLRVGVFIGNQSDRVYIADPNHWLDFAKKYGAIHNRRGMKMYLLQCAQFTTARGDFAQIFELLRE